MFENTKISTIFFIVAISGSLVQANSVPKRECPKICPALYAPVCATDGETFTEFSNACMLQTINCNMERSRLNIFEETDEAWCNTTPVENMNEIFGQLDFNQSDCVKPCTMIYAPLCVANKKYRTTISSKCILDLYNCVLGLTDAEATFRVLKEGPC